MTPQVLVKRGPIEGHSLGVILLSECSMFCGWKLWLPSLVFTAEEGWGEKYVNDGQKEGKGRGGVVEFNRSLFVVAGLATHANSLSSKCDV